VAAIAAIGLNILIGYTGQISLGHGAFFGVGAYSAAILATALGFPFWLSIICAGVITALVGIVFGIPSIRLKHLYLTIATLAGQFIIQYLLVNWTSLTKGAEGIFLPKATLLGLRLKTDRAFFYVIFICFVVMTWMAVNLIRTRYGRAFVAIRDNDRAVMSGAINIYWYKAQAVFIAGVAGAFAGAFMTHYYRFVGMPAFAMDYSILPLTAAVLGGVGTFAGPTIGAFILVPLSESLRAVGPLRVVIYSAILIICVVGLPEGVFHYIRRKYHQFERMVEVG
jgi:branched-chain amino acid transport system permease protein